MQRSRRSIIGTALVVIAIAAVLAAFLATRESEVEKALAVCPDRAGGETVSGGDDGRTIRVEADGGDVSSSGLRCVLDELEVSDALQALITNTGEPMAQTAEDENFHYQWSTHSDGRLEVTITKR